MDSKDKNGVVLERGDIVNIHAKISKLSDGTLWLVLPDVNLTNGAYAVIESDKVEFVDRPIIT